VAGLRAGIASVIAGSTIGSGSRCCAAFVAGPVLKTDGVTGPSCPNTV
jgi:hypothetical protein